VTGQGVPQPRKAAGAGREPGGRGSGAVCAGRSTKGPGVQEDVARVTQSVRGETMLQGQPARVSCHDGRACAGHDLPASMHGGGTPMFLKYFNAA